MRQGEDNQKQNLTLLVFTVVTVVFVSFHTAVAVGVMFVPSTNFCPRLSYRCRLSRAYSG